MGVVSTKQALIISLTVGFFVILTVFSLTIALIKRDSKQAALCENKGGMLVKENGTYICVKKESVIDLLEENK